MALLTTLKLVAAKRSNNASPVVQRRNKLGKKLYEQIQLATAQAEGRVYAPTKLKTLINNETGERTSVEAAKRIKAWWWVAESGKLNLSVRYGAKVIELAKGKNAIELADNAQLLPTLELLKQAVEAGEMDAAIEAASTAVRANFK